MAGRPWGGMIRERGVGLKVPSFARSARLSHTKTRRREDFPLPGFMSLRLRASNSPQPSCTIPTRSRGRRGLSSPRRRRIRGRPWAASMWARPSISMNRSECSAPGTLRRSEGHNGCARPVSHPLPGLGGPWGTRPGHQARRIASARASSRTSSPGMAMEVMRSWAASSTWRARRSSRRL